MKKILVILVILAFVLVGCQKQTEPTPTVSTVEQPAVSAPKTTTVAEAPAQTSQQQEKNALFDKIDWNNIDDKTIVIFVQQFGNEQYVNYGSTKTWRMLMPIKNDFVDFISTYNYKFETITQNSKTLYTFTETSKRNVKLRHALDSQPQYIQSAYEKLLDEYPNLLE